MSLSVRKNSVGNQVMLEKETGRHAAVHLESESRIHPAELRNKKHFSMRISSNEELPYKFFAFSPSV